MAADKALVLQLQEDALDSDRPVSEVLRKAFVVAKKLGINDLLDWLERELNGYEHDAELPPYRRLGGQLKGWNPFHGWLPVQFEEDSIAKLFRTIPCVQSVPELESLLADKDPHGSLVVPASNALTQSAQPQRRVRYPLHDIRVPRFDCECPRCSAEHGAELGAPVGS
jgi:hypothetical protein